MEGQGQHSEEKDDILRLMRGWWSQPGCIMKWTDCVQEELGKREEREEANEEKKQKEVLENECQEGGEEERRRGTEQAEAGTRRGG